LGLEGKRERGKERRERRQDVVQERGRWKREMRNGYDRGERGGERGRRGQGELSSPPLRPYLFGISLPPSA
jgi:hypothetical protein